MYLSPLSLSLIDNPRKFETRIEMRQILFLITTGLGGDKIGQGFLKQFVNQAEIKLFFFYKVNNIY